VELVQESTEQGLRHCPSTPIVPAGQSVQPVLSSFGRVPVGAASEIPKASSQRSHVAPFRLKYALPILWQSTHASLSLSLCFPAAHGWQTRSEPVGNMPWLIRPSGQVTQLAWVVSGSCPGAQLKQRDCPRLAAWPASHAEQIPMMLYVPASQSSQLERSELGCLPAAHGKHRNPASL
jgi:hypothetical protein